jgi:hypothetical protein
MCFLLWYFSNNSQYLPLLGSSNWYLLEQIIFKIWHHVRILEGTFWIFFVHFPQWFFFSSQLVRNLSIKWIKLFAHWQCTITVNITYQNGDVNNKEFCWTVQAGSGVSNLPCGSIVTISLRRLLFCMPCMLAAGLPTFRDSVLVPPANLCCITSKKNGLTCTAAEAQNFTSFFLPWNTFWWFSKTL